MGKAVLVTGAKGFVGGNILSRLQSAGWEAWGLSRQTPEGRILSADLRNYSETLTALEAVDFDCVVHAAASVQRGAGSEEENQLNNSVSTENLVQAAREAGIPRFLFLSSVTVFGRAYELTELSAPTHPYDWYSRSKVAGEQAVVNSGLESLVLRLPSVLGPNPQADNIVATMFRDLKAKGCVELFGDGSARRQFVDVEDLSALVEKLLAQAWPRPTSLVPVVGTEPVTLRQLAEKVVQVYGRGEVKFRADRANSPDQFIATALTQSLPFQGRSLEESLARTRKGFA